MDVNKILNADFLDILFDGKNKEYGAYQLRKQYPKTMAEALIITAALLVLVFLGSLLANKVSKNTTAEIDVLETQMADIKKDEVTVHVTNLSGEGGGANTRSQIIIRSYTGYQWGTTM